MPWIGAGVIASGAKEGPVNWWLSRSGQPEGPLSEEQILGEIRAGRVPPSAHVADQGGQWRPITTVPQFAHAFGGAPPAPEQPKVAATMAMDANQFVAAVEAAKSSPGSSAGSAPGSMPMSTPQPYGATPQPYGATPQPYGAPPQGAAMPQGAGAMHAAHGAAKPKSKLPLVLGVGCGLFALIGLCVAGGAVGYFMWGRDGFSRRTLELAEVMRAVAVEGSHADANLWSGGASAFATLSPEARGTITQLGADPEVLFTIIEVKACDGPVRVSGAAIVFPDGRVRWHRAGAYHFPELGECRGWPSHVGDPQEGLLEGVDRLVESVAADCSAEWVTADDLDGIPSELSDELLRRANDENLREECHRVRRDATWQRAIDEVSVVVRGNGQNATIHTRFLQDEYGSLTLEPIRVRVIRPRAN